MGLRNVMMWWDHVLMQTWYDEQWLQNVGMHKATFLDLCAELFPALRHRDTRMRTALTEEKQVVITL